MKRYPIIFICLMVLSLWIPLFASNLFFTSTDNAIHKQLRAGSILSKEKLYKGTSGALKVGLENNVFAVWKPADADKGYSIQTEVLTAKLDRFLRLGLVPATIFRTIEGREGSFQLFIPGAEDIIETERRPNALDYAKQSFLDYLIDNGDRYESNFLVKKDGRIVSIDHGIAFLENGFRRFTFEERRSLINEFMLTHEGQQVVERLIQILTSSELFLSDVSKYIPKENAYQLLYRIYNILILYPPLLSAPEVKVLITHFQKEKTPINKLVQAWVLTQQSELVTNREAQAYLKELAAKSKNPYSTFCKRLLSKKPSHSPLWQVSNKYFLELSASENTSKTLSQSWYLRKSSSCSSLKGRGRYL